MQDTVLAVSAFSFFACLRENPGIDNRRLKVLCDKTMH